MKRRRAAGIITETPGPSKAWIRRGAAAAAVLAAAACGPPEEAGGPEAAPDDLELARVGDRSIRLGEVRAFYDRMPESLRSSESGVDSLRDHLRTLIDMQLLRREALARGVDRSGPFRSKIRRYERDRVVGFYLRDKVDVTLTRDEVRAAFAAKGLTRRVRFGQIVAASLDSARAAIDDVRAGTPFEEAARRWSIHEGTASQGGDTEKYVDRKSMLPDMADALFGLARGQLSEPVDLGGAYGVFTVLDEFEGELGDEALASAYQEVYKERSQAQRAAVVDSLARAYSLQVDRGALGRFQQALRDQDLAAAADTGPICRYDGGQVTGAEILDAIDPIERQGYATQGLPQVEARLLRTSVGDALLARAALEAGYGERPEVADWLARKREEELIVQLRVQILDERVRFTEQDVRAEYEANPDRYRRPVVTEIQEVLLETEAEAEALLERLRAGEAIADHVHRTLRSPEQRDEQGRLRLKLADATRGFGRLAIRAYTGKEGELAGPVHVPGGYSVFQVVSKDSEPATFEEARRRARATVNWIRKQQVFEAFLEELRREHADAVTVNEEHLRRAAGL